MESEVVFVRKLAFVCQLENPAALFCFFCFCFLIFEYLHVFPQTSSLVNYSAVWGCLGCSYGCPCEMCAIRTSDGVKQLLRACCVEQLASPFGAVELAVRGASGRKQTNT